MEFIPEISKACNLTRWEVHNQGSDFGHEISDFLRVDETSTEEQAD